MNHPSFQLKASSFPLTSFILLAANLDLVDKELASLVKKTPHFFDGTPLFIDLTEIEARQLPIDFSLLLACLRRHRLTPIGIKSYNDAHKAEARSQHLAIFAQTETDKPIASTKPSLTAKATSLLIDQPIRSGKQVYARGGDLIITSTVSPGAEVLADGNIHVYGTLHGRALAGVQGDENARIFCKKLDAELVAIAGHYLVNEKIPETYKTQSSFLEIFLDEQTLQFKTI